MPDRSSPRFAGAGSWNNAKEAGVADTRQTPTDTRRAEMFVAPEHDPRTRLHTTGDERSVLTEILGGQRATLELKCAGLGSELARRSVAPSTLSLLGLVRHLADIERHWFRRVLAGEKAPPLFTSAERPDDDFDGANTDPGSITAAWGAWRAEVAFADRFTTAASDLGLTGEDPGLGKVSLRWVLAHMIEEYARHNGHADLLRERIDGAVGL
ncbi:DinB family protein [Nocardia coffeae]|uniref:DinB family protein n=1 Tax=Nocardia coffeae TaxID=2873381 RepID=UPI0027DFF978|nr:DinB family protein [Nocardia coffeae]